MWFKLNGREYCLKLGLDEMLVVRSVYGQLGSAWIGSF
jgi:hypothetical protein